MEHVAKRLLVAAWMSALATIAIACSDESPGRLMGTLSVGRETAEFDVGVSWRLGNRYTATTEERVLGLEIELQNTDPRNVGEGQFPLEGAGGDIVVTFYRTVDGALESAEADGGTIDVTNSPTAEDPTWRGSISNAKAEFVIDGTMVVMPTAEFEVTFSSDAIDSFLNN